MDPFYIIFGVSVLAFLFILSKVLSRGGSSRGGRVITRFTADFKILDPRFEGCRPEADYCIFKEGKPHKIEIEVERLPLEVGDVLDFYINRELLGRVSIDRKHEAEFEHWSDGNVQFPQIKAGDTVEIFHHETPIISGVFRQK